MNKDSDLDKAYNLKYNMLHLDNEIYSNREDMVEYIILTNEELREIKRKTLERMKEYNNNIKSYAGFSDEDIKKLERNF
jgi:hypothetical protein